METLSITDTCILRAPLYYGQFTWSPRDRNPYKAYFSKAGTSIMWTLTLLPLVSEITTFDCTLVFSKKNSTTDTSTFYAPNENLVPTALTVLHSANNVRVVCIKPNQTKSYVLNLTHWLECTVNNWATKSCFLRYQFGRFVQTL